MTLFSIITITYNNIDGLRKTHKSVKVQNHDDYEWIVIDGGSDDESVPYLESIEAYYISETDRGIYDAMNKGIEHASGHYVIFMNAGDCFASDDVLSQTYSKLNKKNYDFVYGDAMEEYDNRHVLKKSRPSTKITEGMFTHHQAMFYKRALLSDLAYDMKYLIAADYDLTWRVLNRSKNILRLEFPICLFESGGISQKNVLLGRIEQFRIRKAHKINWFINFYIFTKQTLAYKLRQIAPSLYWYLKKR